MQTLISCKVTFPIQQYCLIEIHCVQVQLKHIVQDGNILFSPQITMAVSGEDSLPVNPGALSEMQAVATLARTVQRTIADTKRKILKLENEIDNPSD